MVDMALDKEGTGGQQIHYCFYKKHTNLKVDKRILDKANTKVILLQEKSFFIN